MASDGCEVNLAGNASHCGACGHACGTGEYCSHARCICPAGAACETGVLSADYRFDAATGMGTDSSVQMNTATPVNAPTTSTGYSHEAVTLAPPQYLTVASPRVPLGTSPRTVEAWVRPTGYPDPAYSGILSYGPRSCSPAGSSQVLSLGTVAAGGFVSSANWCDDLAEPAAGPRIALGTWNHVAYTYDGVSARALYVNGVQVAMDTPAPAINTMLGVMNIGATDNPAGRFFQGDIDQLRVWSVARSAAQILDDATLAAHFTLDSTTMVDDGPNHLNGTTMSTTAVAGHVGMAASFSGMQTSYASAGGFTALGQTHMPNQPFSMAMWINPTAASGILVHVSQASNGGGWCTPFLGFDATGHLVGQIYSNGADAGATTSAAIPTGMWTHVALTWSMANGVRVYVNGTLTAMNTAVTTYSASGAPDFITLGSELMGGGCSAGPITTGPYSGLMDDVWVYSRELTAAEVATFAAQ
jgi:hypothetical protein